MRRLFGFLVIPVVGLGFAGPASAGVDPAVIAAVEKAKAADYPSANTLLVVDDQAVVFQPSGQFTNTAHTVTMALTEEARRRPHRNRCTTQKTQKRWRS